MTKTTDADPLLVALLHALDHARASAPRSRAVAEGTTLVRAGQVPTSLYYVRSGEVRLLRHTPAGRVAVMQRVHHGPVAEASLESRRYHCDMVCSRPTELLQLPIDAVRVAIDTEPAVQRLWMQHLTREVIRLRATVERLCLDTAAERIAHAITLDGRDYCLTLRGTRRQWADELAMSHEALYRALRRMKEDGKLMEPKPGVFQLLH